MTHFAPRCVVKARDRAMAMLTVPELAIILAADPAFELPAMPGRAEKMRAARQLVAFGGYYPATICHEGTSYIPDLRCDTAEVRAEARASKAITRPSTTQKKARLAA